MGERSGPGVSATRAADGAHPSIITASWKRSAAAGLTPDDRGMRSVLVEDLDLQHRMVQCAMPILSTLQDEQSGMPLGIALTNERAELLLRRDADSGLARHFEAVCFAPGFDYSENLVGTNGIGTAIESGAAVYVHGDQHFKSSIRHFTCAGAPIKNPLTGQLEGLVDISCLAKDANPLMRQLVMRAASDIQDSLKAASSDKQQLMLQAFLAASRSRRVAVYSLGCGVFMANQAAATLLDPVDEAFLREEAKSMLAPMPCERIRLVLPSGREVAVRRTVVEDGMEAVGVVLEVGNPRPAPTSSVRVAHLPTMPGVAGTSEVWRRCRADMSRLVTTASNVVVRGEPGSGRATLVRGAHLHSNPLAHCALVDCAAPGAASAVVAALASAATSVVLRRIDELPEYEHALVADAIGVDQRDYPARWVVATVGTDRSVPQELAGFFDTALDVPALRHHGEDVMEIARLHVTQLAPRRDVQFDDEAVRILRAYHWPGNGTELVTVLRVALRARPVGPIRAADLPACLSTTARRPLSAMEIAERDTIVAALRTAGGNRVRAAQCLGISRSSLYRKIERYGILE